MSPRSRLATSGDVDDLARLLVAFDDEFATEHDPVEVLAARFAGLLSGGHAFAVLVDAEEDPVDGPVGFGLVTLRPTIWFDGALGTLDELYVAPAHRGRGLGTALLTGVREELGRRGGEELHVNVDEVDVDARRFYERHGLVNVEREEDGRMLLYAGPVDRDGRQTGGR